MHFLPNRLTVANCSIFHAQQVNALAYACPSGSGTSSFLNHEYFALYWKGAARAVARLHGIVNIDPQSGFAYVHCNNELRNGLTNQALETQARERLQQMFPKVKKQQKVFVLGPLYPTLFYKPTAGGMLHRKLYFDVGSMQPQSAQDLARKLSGLHWEAVLTCEELQPSIF